MSLILSSIVGGVSQQNSIVGSVLVDDCIRAIVTSNVVLILFVHAIIIKIFLSEEWNATGWIGPSNALYRNLDNMDCLTPMKGTELSYFDPLAPGKVICDNCRKFV